MNTSKTKRIALIGASMLTAVLAGCSVDGYTAAAAQKRCATHGGLQQIYNELIFAQHAICADGTIVHYVDKRPAAVTAR